MLLPRGHEIIYRFRFQIALMILLCITATATAKDAVPKPAPLTLEIQPTEITLDLSTAAHGHLLVVAHNPSRTLVTGNLKFVAPLGLVTKVDDSSPMPSAGDLFWVVDVTGTGSLPSPVKVVAELTYSFTTGQPQIIVAATAAVTLAQPQSATDAIKATLLPAEGTVDELTPLNLQLQIDNPTRRSIEVKVEDKDFTLLAPTASYVTLIIGKSSTPSASTDSASIAPGAGLTFR